MGQTAPLRNDVLDGAISISALHWLLLPGAGLGLPTELEDEDAPSAEIYLQTFFTSLRQKLRVGSRAVLHVRGTPAKLLFMERVALNTRGFSGGLCFDYPHRGTYKKFFLCLIAQEEGNHRTAYTQPPACPLALPYRAACALWWWREILGEGSNDGSSGKGAQSRSAQRLCKEHQRFQRRLVRLRARAAQFTGAARRCKSGAQCEPDDDSKKGVMMDAVLHELEKLEVAVEVAVPGCSCGGWGWSAGSCGGGSAL
jgi:hypothetical protein